MASLEMLSGRSKKEYAKEVQPVADAPDEASPPVPSSDHTLGATGHGFLPLLKLPARSMHQGGQADVRVERIAALVMFAVWLSACAGSGAPPESSPAHDAASHEQSASAAPSAPASGDPTTACALVEPDGEPFEVVIETISYAYDTELIEGPTHCQPFVITFTNNDLEPNEITTNEHDVDIRTDNVLGNLVFDGELINGGTTIRYEVPGLPAGEHYFYCSEHAPVMNGTLVVGEQ